MSMSREVAGLDLVPAYRHDDHLFVELKVNVPSSNVGPVAARSGSSFRNTSKGLQPHWRQRHRTVKSLVPLRTWIFLRVPRRRRLKMTSLGRKFSLKLVPPG